MLNKLFNEILLLSIAGSILALFILFIKAIFRQKLSSKLHYYLWFIVILRLVIPLSFQPHLNLFNSASVYDKFDISSYVKLDSSNILSPINKEAANSVNDTEEIKHHASVSSIIIKASSKLWIAGSAIFLLYVLLINIKMIFKLKNSKTCEDERVLKVFNHTRNRLNIAASIKIICNPDFKAPAVYGLLTPKILISGELINNVTDEELKFILSHELTHIKRKDLYLNLLLILLQIVYWFNPLTWYVLCRIKEDCELACDADTLKFFGSEEVLKYGSTIISMLKFVSKTGISPAAMGFVSKYNKRRIIMITRFKKTSVTAAILAAVMAIMAGCASTVLPSNEAVKSSANATGNIKASNTDKNEPSQSTAPADSSTSRPSASPDTPNIKVDNQDELLKNIMMLAKQGKIINSEFPVKTTVIDKVEQKLGAPDKEDWVPSAKGSYATFSKYNLVFGYNKGSQIFEARSFDSSLKNILLSMVKNAYGAPAYNVKSNNEQIIGYTAGNEYKLLLVFSIDNNGSNDLKLDHYSILYPKGTVNMMADDPGRQW